MMMLMMIISKITMMMTMPCLPIRKSAFPVKTKSLFSILNFLIKMIMMMIIMITIKMIMMTMMMKPVELIDSLSKLNLFSFAHQSTKFRPVDG